MRQATFRRSHVRDKDKKPKPSEFAASSTATTFDVSLDGRRAYPQVDTLSIEELVAPQIASGSNEGPFTDPPSQFDPSSSEYDDFRHWFDPENDREAEVFEIEQQDGLVVQIEEEDGRKRYQSSVRRGKPF